MTARSMDQGEADACRKAVNDAMARLTRSLDNHPTNAVLRMALAHVEAGAVFLEHVEAQPPIIAYVWTGMDGTKMVIDSDEITIVRESE